MDMIRLTATAALAACALGLAAGADAQPRTRAPAVGIHVTAQLPVAVVRAEAAGAPRADLVELVRELRRADVPANDVIDIIRFVPIATDIRFPTRDGTPGADGARLSDRVRFLLDRGVRGTALADEIHRELRAQGVPAGRDAARRGPPPISRGYIPAEARRGMRERGERGDPAAGTERRGPPTEAGQRRGGPPADTTQRGGGPPADAGRRGGGSPADPDRRGGGPPLQWRA